MAPVGFFTPVSFGTQLKSSAETLLEKIDDYFYLGGPKARIFKTYHSMKTGEVQEEVKAVLVNENQSFRATCLKVVSYFALALPAIPLITKAEVPLALSCFGLVLPIILITKAILRLTHAYEIDPRSIKALAHELIKSEVIETLELNLDEEWKVEKQDSFSDAAIPFTLRQAATEVIAKINEALQKNFDAKAPIKEQRAVTLFTNPPAYENGSNLYYYAKCCGVQLDLPADEQIKKKWFNRIIEALEKRNHIQVLDIIGHAYCIQA